VCVCVSHLGCSDECFSVSIQHLFPVAPPHAVVHMQVENSMESNAFRSIGTKLSKAIAESRSRVEPTAYRLSWGLKGLSVRLIATGGKIPENEKKFFKAVTHVLRLVADVREAVLGGRAQLLAQFNEEGTMVDCLIWKKASIAFTRQAEKLDHQLSKLMLLARTTQKIIKCMAKVYQRKELLKSSFDVKLHARAIQAGWQAE